MDLVQQPKHTLYINNLNDKISVDELKLNLYHLFSQYGFVVDIIVRKTKKMRGQAFIVFSDVASAANAHRSMQGLPLFNKRMRIQFSKLEADIIVRVKGLQSKKRKDVPGEAAPSATKKPKANGAAAAESAADGVEKLSVDPDAAVDAEKSATVEQDMELNTGAEGNADGTDADETNNVLFVQNLPNDFPAEMLSQLFEQLEGFVEARKPPDQNVGFVEFDSVHNATTAMQSLQGFNLSPTHGMQISYRRK